MLGKTNLSEWANFRSTQSSSGWSGRGGQGSNPYVLDRNPCGSSSGSGQAVSANLAAAAVGTETDGSIVCPSSTCGIVGIKPTLGLVSRSGIIPIAHSQDTAGPMARTVADAAALLNVLAGVDPRDPATSESEGRAEADYTQFLDADGLRGARIGVARNNGFGSSPETDAITENSIAELKRLGATIVDPADVPHISEYGDSEFEVLLYEFKADLNAYLADLEDSPVRTLEEIIAFNDEHANEELLYFGQEIFLQAQEKGPLTEQAYLDALAKNLRLSRSEGIDAVMDENNLDALIAPTGSPAWTTDLINGDHFLLGSSSPAAVAGYPNITVPAGYSFGLPVGLSFFGRAYSEPVLIRLAYAFEQGTTVRRAPAFLPVADLRSPDGLPETGAGGTRAEGPLGEIARCSSSRRRLRAYDSGASACNS
ncbi:MAG: amidase [Chloroflexia bacterium]